MIFFVVFLFILGISVGSFLNVVIDRLPFGKPITGRSHCDRCGKILSWFDLVPLFSFLFLHGKCRYCQKLLSWYYPIVELTTGILFILTCIIITKIVTVITIMQLVFFLFIVSSLIVIFFTDLKYGIIPDKIIYLSIVVTFIYLILNTKYLILSHLLSAIGAFLFFLLLFFITRGRGMGLGDVKFAFLQGLLLGWPNILIGVYAAFLTGAVAAIILVVWGKKRFRGSTIPFGPFLVIGTIIALFWGAAIWQKALPGLLL